MCWLKKNLLAEFAILLVLISLNKSLVIAFISILIHEIAHIIVAKRRGGKFNNLQVHIYGALAEFTNIDEMSEGDKVAIYLSGPISNFVIICIFTIINTITKNSVFESIISINIGLCIFNLLPAYPLDGARILEAVLSRKMLYKKVNKIIIRVSYFISTIFLTVFILIFIYKHTINLSMAIAGITIFYITKKENETSAYILMGNIFIKRRKLLKDKYIENRSISVYYKQGLANVMSIIDKNKFNIFYVLDDELRVIFTMNEYELIEALKKYGNMSLEEYFNKHNDDSL